MVSMNGLSTEQRAGIVGCLVEGMSIRATCRVTGAAKNTVTKLLVDLGQACSAYQDQTLRGLTTKRVECDEIWSFCSWMVGNRDAIDATAFIEDLAGRLANRIQLTTDGHKAYLEAVEVGFGSEVDYAMLIKLYGRDHGASDTRYSPAICTGVAVQPVQGDPDPGLISTSYVERQNLTMRMGMRRFTRLTNAFSKKVENLAHAVSLHFMHYNFGRPHKTLSTRYPATPAMAAGVADHVWTLQEIAGLLDSN